MYPCGRELECQAYAFAPPACAAKRLAAGCADYVTSVVVADDIAAVVAVVGLTQTASLSSQSASVGQLARTVSTPTAAVAEPANRRRLILEVVLDAVTASRSSPH